MRKYIFEVHEIDGKIKLSSECDGFNSAEILGFVAWKHDDIIRQIRGEIKPDSVTRTLVKVTPQEAEE